MNIGNTVSSFIAKIVPQVAPTEAAPFDREAYRAYRTDWKITYKVLSEEIRALKLTVKNKFRRDDYAGNDQNHLRASQNTATEMLEDLKERKAEFKAAAQAEAAARAEVAAA